MTPTARRARVVVAAMLLAAPACRATAPDDPHIVFERVPHEGIQPQAVADTAGNVHVVYLLGDPLAADLFYTRRSADGAYSSPIRVNSQPGAAVAAGTVRGGQLALGRDNRVHVVWNGSGQVTPRLPVGMPLMYSRLSAGAFEPQRHLITWSGFVDGGSSVAADAAGRVFVAWHSNPGDGADARAAVYLARSDDDGATFARERRVTDESLGACGCCSMRALVDRRSGLHMLYRSAGKGVDRDSILLTSTDTGDTFNSRRLQPWKIAACPMSTYALADGPGGITAAWETAGQIYWQRGGAALSAAPGEAGVRKHPTLAVNDAGDMLLAWVERASRYQRGLVAWQRYDAAGTPISRGSAEGVPALGLAAAAPLGDGRFLLLY